MYALNLENFDFEIPKIKTSPPMKYTSRDLRICQFLLDMKFSSVEEIHEAFFKMTHFGIESRGFRAAWRRLSLLENSGFIVSEPTIRSGKKIYLPTLKAYRMVEGLLKDQILPCPIRGIDIRTFEHDRDVIKLRLFLESNLKVLNWKSERNLKLMQEYSTLSKMGLIPDAVFENAIGKKTCLEYEVSLKSKRDTEKK